LTAWRKRLGLTYLFVSTICPCEAHVRAGRHHVSRRIVEMGPSEDIFARPRHPYTRALLAAVPKLEPGSLHDTPALPGDPPSGSTARTIVLFRLVAHSQRARCAVMRPPLISVGRQHTAACVRLDEIEAVAEG